jgi:hypothetical protein
LRCDPLLSLLLLTFAIETYSLPTLARGYLAALPSMSLIPLAPFLLLTSYFPGCARTAPPPNSSTANWLLQANGNEPAAPAEWNAAIEEFTNDQAIAIEGTNDQAKALQRTFSRLSELTDVNDLRRELNAIEIGARAGKDSLLGLMKQFDDLVQKASLAQTATLEDLKSKLDSRVKIPFVDRDVDSRTAVIVLSICILALLFFLISLMAGVKLALSKNSEPSGIDWVFFLPGKIGLGLGVLSG